MSITEIILFNALLIGGFISYLNARAAYQNGVTDGYGFAREPRNPGYQLAGEYLKNHMNHRWRELRNESAHVVIDEFHRFPDDQQ